MIGMNIGLKKRFFAWVIDFLITSSVGMILAFSVAALIGIEIGSELLGSKPMLMVMVYFFLPVLVDWLYFAGLHSSRAQATVGKRIQKIVVISESGERITFGRATLRYIAKTICFLTLGLGFIPIRFTRRKQGLHDFFASTVVVKESSRVQENISDLEAYRDALNQKKAK